MERTRKRMNAAREHGRNDAKNGNLPNCVLITNGYGAESKHYQAWRNAYDAGYYESAAAQYRAGMVENADLYAKALMFMEPEQREAFLFEMWKAKEVKE